MAFQLLSYLLSVIRVYMSNSNNTFTYEMQIFSFPEGEKDVYIICLQRFAVLRSKLSLQHIMFIYQVYC